jgi:hypothetical protein
MRLLLVFALAAAAFGQAPDLVKEEATGRDGYPAITLRNASPQAATAWMWRAKSTLDRDHFGQGRVQWSISDSAITGRTTLDPGAAITTQIRPDDPVALEWAVIYADGSTAGDPNLIGFILASRRAALAEIPEWRRALESEPLASVQRKVDERKRIVPVGATSPTLPLSVAWQVGRLLREQAGPAQMLAELDRMRVHLETSKPPLQ